MKLSILIAVCIFLRTQGNAQTVYTYSSSSVEYIGGPKSLYEFFNINVVFPDSVKKGLIGGTVYLKFQIDSMGTVQTAEILKGVAGCVKCDKEALRVTKLLPKGAFKPAVEMNARIPSTYNLTVRFKLDSKAPIIYSGEHMLGDWTFADESFAKCVYCPDIKFFTTNRAVLLADSLSWKIENNKLIISNIGTPTRENHFLKDSVYDMTFKNYFKQLVLIGQTTTYYLMRK